MDLLTYQEKAITTKMYDDSIAKPYVILGLCGEISELYEKVVEAVYSNNRSEEKMKLLRKEVGDVMWYAAAWAHEVDYQLVGFVSGAIAPSPFAGTTELLDTIVIKGGVCAENMKKALRDDFRLIQTGGFPASKEASISKAVGDIVKLLQCLCRKLVINFDEALQENISKLQSRKDRGVLSGSGDER